MDWGDDSDGDDDFGPADATTTDLIRIASICSMRAGTSTFTGVQICGVQALTATAAQAIGVKIVGLKALSVNGVSTTLSTNTGASLGNFRVAKSYVTSVSGMSMFSVCHPPRPRLGSCTRCCRV
mmetsp:Transcript_2747/g.6669  ORF Transcript_2747/g.6669 Transcript_2747/m.6669 type:complete len:124 (-) Transcript_2747:317-688(-)